MEDIVNTKEFKNQDDSQYQMGVDVNEDKKEQALQISQTKPEEKKNTKNSLGEDEETEKYFDENETLLKTKKTKLGNKFEEIKKKFDSWGNINIYDIIIKEKEESFSNEIDNKNDSKNKENIKKIKNKKCIYFL